MPETTQTETQDGAVQATAVEAGAEEALVEESLVEDFESVRRLAASNFGDAGVFLEHFVQRARHVEVQILGDGKGSVVTIGERDCSLQRRNQKVVEECPAFFVPGSGRLSRLGKL